MSAWTHVLCDACWAALNPERVPVRLRFAPVEACCRCRVTTNAGIHVRGEPERFRCGGRHVLDGRS